MLIRDEFFVFVEEVIEDFLVEMSQAFEVLAVTSIKSDDFVNKFASFLGLDLETLLFAIFEIKILGFIF